MSDIDSILNAEKNRQHQLDNPDLLAFSVLTEIARIESKARLRKHLITGLVLALAASILIIQVVVLSIPEGRIDVYAIADWLMRRINDNPLIVTVFNLGLATIIVLTRKRSFF